LRKTLSAGRFSLFLPPCHPDRNALEWGDLSPYLLSLPMETASDPSTALGMTIKRNLRVLRAFAVNPFVIDVIGIISYYHSHAPNKKRKGKAKKEKILQTKRRTLNIKVETKAYEAPSGLK
jgi:hypothetical protein